MNVCSSYPLKVTGKERQEIDDNLKWALDIFFYISLLRYDLIYMRMKSISRELVKRQLASSAYYRYCAHNWQTSKLVISTKQIINGVRHEAVPARQTEGGDFPMFYTRLVKREHHSHFGD